MNKHLISLVAGEPSGDLIAAQIVKGIHQAKPEANFFGIGGPALQAQGMHLNYPMDALSVFGYVDALKSLPKLIQVYSGIKKQIIKQQPGVFIGVDAPDFNLRLEHSLKQKGIKTVHFVSPSIWAWRYERIHKIRQAVDHMLVLFPFEVDIYQKEGIPVTFVGHPLANKIPFEPDQQEARQRLKLPTDAKILAILPGSRTSEIKHLAPVFLQTAQKLQAQEPDLHFIVPLVNQARKQQFLEIAANCKLKHLHLFDTPSVDQPVSWDVMQACDAALLSSGTATLEMALFKKPMVIAYILTPLMLKIMTWKAGQDRPSVPWIGLPNILLQEFAVPEYLQEDVEPEGLSQACLKALEDEAYRQTLMQKFQALHQTLALDTGRIAAQKIIEVIES
ncbi:lipid-A-disaccharide synthase [Brackiella oedipodis]|uniref:lipid-A-disaccharide synthase n=1 Tax=Brackiella oedipodis TaxID=124225 RepID=UPI00057017A4|nr:lipid-A-disaccharide synthase [Brackiella oedipodis]